MQCCQVVELLSESGLSPEGIAERLAVSSSTYRRWLRATSKEKLPPTYQAHVSGAVYKLLGEGLLNYDSPNVSKFLKKNLPDFFQAAITGLHVTPDAFSDDSPHQDKITAVLSHLGHSGNIRKQVDKASVSIETFAAWGETWKQRVQLLSSVIKSKEFALVDKLVAYGALFYLILPFDLIPDAIPVFGYVDDFGILGFAAAYYIAKFPKSGSAEKSNTIPA